MIGWWRERRRQRLLQRYAIDDALWEMVLGESPAFARLSPEESGRLRELTVLFLAEKRFFGTHGLTVDDHMGATVAARACLLILNLGLDHYDGWRTVILYPGGFVAEREVEDEIGVVHTGIEALDGESMYGGSVVLNWEEVCEADLEEGVDVVLHEFAHKLDQRNGDANGLPRLHSHMPVLEWSRTFNAAFETFSQWVDEDRELPFDDYAATDPAEFFAVATEAFFLNPGPMLEMLPDVYGQLAQFYRQEPAGFTASKVSAQRAR